MQQLQVELALKFLLLRYDTHCVLTLPKGCRVAGSRLHDF